MGAVRLLLILLCLAAIAGVFVSLLVSVVRHRRAGGSSARHFHRHLGTELGWTLAPMLIVSGLLFNVFSLSLLS